MAPCRPPLDILSAVHPHIDIAEIGTPLVFREGMKALRRIRAEYPQPALTADLKIMDAGKAEADIAFDSGADLVTVMAVAADATIAGALNSAAAHGKRVMVDMMQVADTRARALELASLGCDLLCLHTAHDQQAAIGSPLCATGGTPRGAAVDASGDRWRPQAIRPGADPAVEAADYHRRFRHHRFR